MAPRVRLMGAARGSAAVATAPEPGVAGAAPPASGVAPPVSVRSLAPETASVDANLSRAEPPRDAVLRAAEAPEGDRAGDRRALVPGAAAGRVCVPVSAPPCAPRQAPSQGWSSAAAPSLSPSNPEHAAVSLCGEVARLLTGDCDAPAPRKHNCCHAQLKHERKTAEADAAKAAPVLARGTHLYFIVDEAPGRRRPRP